MIEVQGLTKHYGEKVAVEDLTFTVRPGIVTGFLGPNGAGKSTTMRMILGLDAPTAGSVRIDGRRYRDLAAPLHEVGAMLEARAIHTGRSAFHHLLAMAQTQGISRRRVHEVLDLVGLTEVANQRAGGFSLGMSQRLGIASALLGDPAILILDEPANGLDPEGILWVRRLLEGLAAEGRTVFLSSHMRSEIALTADHLVVIGRGRLIADSTVAEVVSQATVGAAVLVRSPRVDELWELLSGPAVEIARIDGGALSVRGVGAEAIGELAARNGIALHELTPQQASLEDAFMRLTGDAVEYHAAGPPSASLEEVA